MRVRTKHPNCQTSFKLLVPQWHVGEHVQTQKRRFSKLFYPNFGFLGLILGSYMLDENETGLVLDIFRKTRFGNLLTKMKMVFGCVGGLLTLF